MKSFLIVCVTGAKARLSRRGMVPWGCRRLVFIDGHDFFKIHVLRCFTHSTCFIIYIFIKSRFNRHVRYPQHLFYLILAAREAQFSITGRIYVMDLNKARNIRGPDSSMNVGLEVVFCFFILKDCVLLCHGAMFNLGYYRYYTTNKL